VVPEAPLERTEHGLVAVGSGWFVLTKHVIVGAGDGVCVVIAMSSRQNQAFGPYGEYVADEVARKHRSSPPETAQDVADPDVPWSPSEPASYRDGWLPIG
jgi:hypothetical protein